MSLPNRCHQFMKVQIFSSAQLFVATSASTGASRGASTFSSHADSTATQTSFRSSSAQPVELGLIVVAVVGEIAFLASMLLLHVYLRKKLLWTIQTGTTSSCNQFALGLIVVAVVGSIAFSAILIPLHVYLFMERYSGSQRDYRLSFEAKVFIGAAVGSFAFSAGMRLLFVYLRTKRYRDKLNEPSIHSQELQLLSA